jgi:hypothetical protein
MFDSCSPGNHLSQRVTEAALSGEDVAWKTQNQPYAEPLPFSKVLGGTLEHPFPNTGHRLQTLDIATRSHNTAAQVSAEQAFDSDQK